MDNIHDSLPPGIIKICSGLLESCKKEPYITNIAMAERMVATNYSLSDDDEKKRQKIIEAIKLNLINRKEYNLADLMSVYGITMKKCELRDEQNKFCYALATLCGFI